MALHPEQHTPIEGPWVPTWEQALYGVIVALALGLRLAGLGAWPLLEEEAATALASWRMVRGTAGAQPAHYSPLLFSAHLVLFALFTASDGAVRLLPALVGGLIPAAFYLLRRYLGRYGALSGAALLAVAPTWLFFSRTAATPILSAACMLLVVVAAVRYLYEAQARDAALGVIALGLGLGSGPEFYTLLFAGGLALAIALLIAGENRLALRQTLSARWRSAATRRNALLLLGVWLAASTALLFHPGGIGASVDLAGWWSSALFTPGELAPWTLPRVLLTYEFLTMTLALIGLAWGLRRQGTEAKASRPFWDQRSPLALFFGFWALIALIMGTLGGHREPMWTVAVLLPLLLLAARGAELLWRRLLHHTDVYDLVAITVGLSVLSFCFLQVAAYTHRGQIDALNAARITLGLLIVAWAAYWYWRGSDAALRVSIVTIAAIMLLFTGRGAMAVAYHTARDAREPLVHRPVSRQMTTFATWIRAYSSRQAIDAHALDIAYVHELEPWMGWYLRTFNQAQAITDIRLEPDRRALVTLPLAQETRPPGYMAKHFRFREEWPSQPLTFRERLRWFLYRDPIGHGPASEFQVWVHPPIAEQ
jgi:uncharacterized protein (TIGR03663 family)